MLTEIFKRHWRFKEGGIQILFLLKSNYSILHLSYTSRAPQSIRVLGGFPLEDISCSCSYLRCMEYSRRRDTALLSASEAELFSITLFPIQAALLCTHHLWWPRSRRWQPAVLGVCSRELCVWAQSAALCQWGKMCSVTFAYIRSSCKKQFFIYYHVGLKAELG